jgi:hypothetical protein
MAGEADEIVRFAEKVREFFMRKFAPFFDLPDIKHPASA